MLVSIATAVEHEYIPFFIEALACSACMEFAISAFGDQPMRSGVTQITSPLDQRVLGLHHDKRMSTSTEVPHGGSWMSR